MLKSYNIESAKFSIGDTQIYLEQPYVTLKKMVEKGQLCSLALDQTNWQMRHKQKTELRQFPVPRSQADSYVSNTTVLSCSDMLRIVTA